MRVEGQGSFLSASDSSTPSPPLCFHPPHRPCPASSVLVSSQPAAIASILGPLVGAINTFQTCLNSCAGLCSSDNLGAASGTAMAITAGEGAVTVGVDGLESREAAERS